MGKALSGEPVTGLVGIVLKGKNVVLDSGINFEGKSSFYRRSS